MRRIPRHYIREVIRNNPGALLPSSRRTTLHRRPTQQRLDCPQNILDAEGHGRSSRHQAKRPISQAAGTDAPSGVYTPDSQGMAPSHDPGSNSSRETSCRESRGGSACENDGQRPASDHGSERTAHDEVLSLVSFLSSLVSRISCLFPSLSLCLVLACSSNHDQLSATRMGIDRSVAGARRDACGCLQRQLRANFSSDDDPRNFDKKRSPSCRSLVGLNIRSGHPG